MAEPHYLAMNGKMMSWDVQQAGIDSHMTAGRAADSAVFVTVKG